LRNANKNRRLLYRLPNDGTPLIKPVFTLIKNKFSLIPILSFLSSREISEILQYGITKKLEKGESELYIPDRVWDHQ